MLKKPLWFVVSVLDTPSWVSVITTLAPGTAAPVLSTTVPSMALKNCARAGGALKPQTNNEIANVPGIRLITPPKEA
jgi:hypothetical protein